ncbi:MAG: hypothetical protein ABI114_14335 [Rhodanobacter sp.]
MKKTSLLLAVSAVLLSGLLLSGCGIFRSHKAWDKAQQESPLEIPPSMSRPSTSDALVIPPRGANEPTANGATADLGGQVSDGFVLAGDVDSVYHRVGKVLESGSLGKLVSHDDATHTYKLVATGATQKSKQRGFLSRMFGRDKTDSVSAPAGSGRQVQVSVGTSGDSASEVRAQGDSAEVGMVIDALKSGLGK